MHLHSISLALSCRLAKDHGNRTAIIQHKLDNAENKSTPLS